MKALVIGNGGREQALAWKIGLSGMISDIYMAPGNGGQLPKCHNVAIGVSDFEGLSELIKKEGIELVVVGPEVPLVEGVVDYLNADPELEDLYIVGPTKVGAELEGSKDFAKDFMARHGIPTAKYRTFTSETLEEGLRYLREEERAPYVLKADGLAAGKGVVIPETLEEAEAEMREMLGGKFGSAGASVVVESYLKGIECSVFVLTDGKDYMLLPTAKDYKRIGDGDTGLNTGGMGAVSPVPFVDDAFMEKVETRIIRPTIQGLLEDGIDYRGFIFFGLMNVGGDPYVIEYNCRMGDPETEAVMLRIRGDLVGSMLALRDQILGLMEPLLEFDEVATTVVTVSGGYPETYQKGFPILGLSEETEGVQVFHMGTKVDGDQVVTAGGRVLAVSAMGGSIEKALGKAYGRVGALSYEGMNYRKDIGQDLLKL
ncbi:Phosphoribosylamine--glycine ligase [Porphyromonas levii]|uniref:phosphoribosylamine--glycine ligase n=1 Tax=Porphyromonas levii TaxID=28114 RepID=UPI001B8AA08E|nr:phosphoribosylamine--glycine ligase [Porphyromonas levii]MBR8730793.1 Phosphoribosylamine--glycine ligase [Porphyromonas levii]